MAFYARRKYRLVKRDGITAVIIHKKKILLLKRRNIPIILNPGIWAYLSGARDGTEKYIDTAYREIHEEVKLERKSLKFLARGKVWMRDEKRGVFWWNYIFYFRSNTERIKLDLENSKYRWAPFSDITNRLNYTNVFINEQPVLSIIKRFLNGKESK